MTEHTPSESLLSIDVNGHLQKLADHTHRSAYHYPVELVRTALDRGADQIDIRIQSQRLEIVDNGGGIKKEQIKNLFRLMDFSQPPEEREEAIESLKGRRGIGILAIFSPSPQSILIENVTARQSQSIRISVEKGETKSAGEPSLSRGTRIVLFRKTDDRDQEMSILRHYCRGVGEKITLNGRPLKKKPILTETMVKIEAGSSSNYKEAEVGIPVKGDICKIWLMDQGIPWYLFTRSGINGFIFEATVETDQYISTQMMAELSGRAERLYSWLCRRYQHYPDRYRERVDELVFKHHQLTGKPEPLNQLFAFRTLKTSIAYNFAQLKTLAARKNLYAIPLPADLKKYPVQDSNTLLLTPKQMDFLVNRKRLPIPFLTPITDGTRGFGKWLPLLEEKIKYLVNNMNLGSPKIVQLDDLHPEELEFLKILNKYLKANHDVLRFSTDTSKASIQTVMVESRGILPAFIRNRSSSIRLLIRRRHPLIRKSIPTIIHDPRNIEILLPLLGI